MVSRVASRYRVAITRRRREISPDPLLLAALPPERAGVLARGSSAASVVELEATVFIADGASPFCNNANSASASCASRFLGERGYRFRKSSYVFLASAESPSCSRCSFAARRNASWQYLLVGYSRIRNW